MSNKTYHVFVYGTLMGMSRGTFLGPAKTVGKFAMFDGGFPCAVESSNNRVADVPNHHGQIEGQLYSVNEDELVYLDRYEGCDDHTKSGINFYTRKEVLVQNNGIETQAWIYLGEQANERSLSSLIEPNDLGEIKWR